MISKHCGQKLTYVNGRFKNSALTWHKWKCDVCKRSFKQHVRLSEKRIAESLQEYSAAAQAIADDIEKMD